MHVNYSADARERVQDAKRTEWTSLQMVGIGCIALLGLVRAAFVFGPSTATRLTQTNAVSKACEGFDASVGSAFEKACAEARMTANIGGVGVFIDEVAKATQTTIPGSSFLPTWVLWIILMVAVLSGCIAVPILVDACRKRIEGTSELSRIASFGQLPFVPVPAYTGVPLSFYKSAATDDGDPKKRV